MRYTEENKQHLYECSAQCALTGPAYGNNGVKQRSLPPLALIMSGMMLCDTYEKMHGKFPALRLRAGFPPRVSVVARRLSCCCSGNVNSTTRLDTTAYYRYSADTIIV
jgi:hypothetical protein